MSDGAPTNPRGLFDRTSRGATIGPVPVEIERGRIRFFSQVLGETDPRHSDVEAARAAGLSDLAAPPSFFMAVEALANEALKRQGRPTVMDLVRCDFRYLLHGDERFVYAAPIVAGETVSFSASVVDFYDKKGGAMEFVTIESVIAHAERGVLVRGLRTLLHRLPEPRS